MIGGPRARREGRMWELRHQAGGSMSSPCTVLVVKLSPSEGTARLAAEARLNPASWPRALSCTPGCYVPAQLVAGNCGVRERARLGQ